jgi:DNA-binding transcriptional regulator GbsR (MarR family)
VDEDQRHAELAHFVEEVGLMFEQGGLPRMAGRVLGLLLTAQPPHQSAEDLRRALHASKGSISTMTRLLMQIYFIERVSLPGDRRDYFRITPNVWSKMSRARTPQITQIRQLAERGLAILDGAPSEQRARLEEMRDFYAWYERELPALIDRYERERAERLQGSSES